jgi:hypothetical protein
MPAFVYYWGPRFMLKSVGHLSLSLSDGTYISHWPGGGTSGLIKNSGKSESLERDIEMEKRSYDKKLQIPTELIDETSIKNWWEMCNLKYHLLTSNCSQVILLALVAGKMFKYLPRDHTPKYIFSLIQFVLVYRGFIKVNWVKYCVELMTYGGKALINLDERTVYPNRLLQNNKYYD